MQRLRVTFSRSSELKFTSHLDMMRMWDRTLRRAGILIAHSEGFTPHPRISMGAPLPVGVTSEAELMDVHLRRTVSPHFFMKSVTVNLPAGVAILKVEQVALTGPSLQSLLRFADYRVEVETSLSPIDLEAVINKLLQEESLPWQHIRDTGPRFYDLRAQIKNIVHISQTASLAVIGMRLRCDPGGTGRPEQVISALGLEGSARIHRTGLVLAGA